MEDLVTLLPHLLRLSGYDEVVCERAVFALWRRIVGEAVAARAHPVRLRAQRLVVATADRTWKAQLEQLSPEILARLNRALGAELVREIEYRVESRRRRREGLHGVEDFVGPDVRPPAQGEEARDLSPREREDLRELERHAEKIADPDVREAFLRAARRCLRRRGGEG